MVCRGRVALQGQVYLIVFSDPNVLSAGTALPEHGEVYAVPLGVDLQGEVHGRCVAQGIGISHLVVGVKDAVAIGIQANDVTGLGSLVGIVVGVLESLCQRGQCGHVVGEVIGHIQIDIAFIEELSPLLKFHAVVGEVAVDTVFNFANVITPRDISLETTVAKVAQISFGCLIGSGKEDRHL